MGYTLTTKKAADQLGIGRDRVAALIKEGKLPARKLDGRHWAVSEEGLKEFKKTYIRGPRAEVQRNWSPLYRELFGRLPKQPPSREVGAAAGSEVDESIKRLETAVRSLRTTLTSGLSEFEQATKNLRAALRDERTRIRRETIAEIERALRAAELRDV